MLHLTRAVIYGLCLTFISCVLRFCKDPLKRQKTEHKAGTKKLGRWVYDALKMNDEHTRFSLRRLLSFVGRGENNGILNTFTECAGMRAKPQKPVLQSQKTKQS